MTIRKRPDFHQSDERQLHYLGADFDSEVLKRDYKLYRDVYTKAGQKGQLPEAALLAIVVASERAKQPYKERQLNIPPKQKLSPPVEFDDGEHASSDLPGHTEGSSHPLGVAT